MHRFSPHSTQNRFLPSISLFRSSIIISPPPLSPPGIALHRRSVRAYVDLGLAGGGGGTGGNSNNKNNNRGGDDPANNDNDDNSHSTLASTFIIIITTIAGTSIALYIINKRKAKTTIATDTTPVFVIVPTLNESKTITSTIHHLKNTLHPPPTRIIVVDGGSVDNTVVLAKSAGADTVINLRKRGRGRQQNAGARAATPGRHTSTASNSRSSSILMFVHADSRPPATAVTIARRVLSDPNTVLGGFFTLIEHENGRPLVFTTLHNFISTYYAPFLFSPRAALGGLKCMFGDQSIFCRSEDFWRVGGFDDTLPIMEDADLCVRMHHGGLGSGRPGREVQVVSAVNRTSGRRIGSWGNVKATYIQFRIALAWWMGSKSAEELWDLYDRLYTDTFR